MRKGWHRESKRHSLARRGVRTEHTAYVKSKMNASPDLIDRVLSTSRGREEVMRVWWDETDKDEQWEVLDRAGVRSEFYIGMAWSALPVDVKYKLRDLMLKPKKSKQSFDVVWQSRGQDFRRGALAQLQLSDSNVSNYANQTDFFKLPEKIQSQLLKSEDEVDS